MIPRNLLQVKERTGSTRSHHLKTKKPVLPIHSGLTLHTKDHQTKKSATTQPELQSKTPNHAPSCKIIRNEDLASPIPVEFYLSIFGTDRSSVVLRGTVGYFSAENFMNNLVKCDCAEISLLHLRGHDKNVLVANSHGENKKISVHKSYKTVIKTLRKCLFFEFRAMGLNNELLGRLMDNARHCNVYEHVDGLTEKSYFPMGAMNGIH